VNLPLTLRGRKRGVEEPGDVGRGLAIVVELDSFLPLPGDNRKGTITAGDAAARGVIEFARDS
jgi:hypothetical protein